MTQIFYNKFMVDLYKSPLLFFKDIIKQHNNWVIDKEVYDQSNYLIELYIHNIHPITTHISYFSFSYDPGQIYYNNAKYLYWYMNTGFDANSAVNAQPGVTPYNDQGKFRIDRGFYLNTLQAYEIYIYITDISLLINFKRYDNNDDLLLYLGTYHNITAQGAHDSFIGCNNGWWQFNYNNTIYVSSTQLNDASYRQGAFNLDRNDEFWNLPALVDGSRQYTYNTIYINTDSSADNINFHYIGYIEDFITKTDSNYITTSFKDNIEYLLLPLPQPFNGTGIYKIKDDIDKTTFITYISKYSRKNINNDGFVD